MRRTRALWLRRALVLLVGLLGLNCRDSTGPWGLAGHLAFAPTFESSSAGIVDVDRLRITLVRPPSDVVLDTVIAIPPGADSVDLSLTVPLSSSREDLDLYLRLLNSAGDTVFRNTPYPQSVTVRSGSAGSIVPAPLEYVGLGFDATSVVIGTPDTAVLFGDTLLLAATVWGSQAQQIPGTPIAWRSLDSNRVRVPDRVVARVVGGPQRGVARIVAELLTGPADTVLVTAQPVPTAVTRVSGDGQTAVPLAPLPVPLRVRVTASDGLGVQVPVLFRALAAGASVSADTVLSDSLGFAEVIGTLGPGVGPQTFDAQVARIATPVVFTATAVSGTVGSVTLDRTVDTIARGATLQYTATARDSLGNPVSVTIGWTSTVTSVATVDQLGLAQGVGVDSTKIIATAAGHADTALLYVRALTSVVADPADTVITAVGDSFDIRATASDNFGVVLTSGFTRTYSSATPTVVTVHATTGRTRSVGPGNGVIVIRDSVDATLHVQTTATVRVNQTTASIRNTPALPESLQVGVGGRRAIIVQALDRNANPIPNKAFGFRSADPAVATVDAAGIVTGVQLNGATFVIDSVDGFKDSVRVAVVPSPPLLLQWSVDSLAVGNGGSVSVPLTLTRTDSAATTVFLQVLPAVDTLVARPALSCGGPVLRRLSIPALQSGTSVLVCGLKAGRIEIEARDSAGVYSPDTIVVTVVSTVEFREIGAFNQQPNFYANQNETYRAQIFLSDPAPAGGLGVTFVYGRPGTSAITPAPAIIPAGQLAADITIQGLSPGTDSVVPTSGGFVGKFSRVYVAPNQLTLQRPYPYTGTLGIGQTFQPYVGITYAMDHILVVSASLGTGIGTVQSPDTIRKGNAGQYFTVTATAPGKTALTVASSGWVSATDTVIFTTPLLLASGSGSLIAGNPALGSWTASAGDSLRWGHTVRDTLVVSAVSRSPSVVSVDSAILKILPGASGNTRFNALRALPSAGGDSAWIVMSASGYRPDSFLVRVTKPTMAVQVSYPYTGRLGLGTFWQNATYVQLPYARTDTFTVYFTHSRPGAVRAPASVRIPPGQTSKYFDLVGDSIGVDTLRVDTTVTPGYVVTGTPIVYRVDSLHVRPFQYPGATNYTIAPPYAVTVYAFDSADGGTARPLIAPLRVNLVSSDTATFTLDSAAVTIDSGQYYSYNHPDTLRFRGVDSVGARIHAAAAGARPDSSALIRVFPTPLGVQLGYPYTVGRGLRLKSNYAYLTGGNAPDTVKVALRRFDPTLDTLTADTVLIYKGLNYSQAFEIWALDSSRTDSIVATAPGYLPGKVTFTPEPVSLLQGGLPSTRLTTDPPYRPYVYAGTRSRYGLNPFAPVTITVVSTDPNVMRIDSAFSVNAGGDTATAVVDTNTQYVNVRVQFVGNGTARLRYAAAGFLPDSTNLVSVSGPTLHLSTGNQTVGLGQLLPNQYVYVDNVVTGAPLVVTLLRSDSTQPPAGQVFQLSAGTVTIPVGQAASNAFEITGNFSNSAVLTARATAYSQSTATISVGAPQLLAPATATLYVGQVPTSLAVYTADQNSQQRIIAAALDVSSSSSDPAVASIDTALKTVPARSSFVSFPIRPRARGAVNLIFAATGYKADTTVVSVDTAQLSFGAVPLALGLNQTTQMYVTLPFTNDSAVSVSLASSDPAVLTVPPTVVIPARTSSVYFNVSGVGAGSATVTATAAIANAGVSSAVVVGTPKLFVSMSTTSVVGQRLGFTVYAHDSLGNQRIVNAPLAVTLQSDKPGHTVFDAQIVTIPAGSSNVAAGVVFDTAGTYAITATATGYAPGSTPTTASGALVLMTDFAFGPQTVTITRNQAVTWKNQGSVAHTSTSDAPLWNTSNIPAGQTSGPVYLSTAGSYTYHCNIHPAMTGTIIVNP
ncbi:MAG: cupredoxin domain-containing protein [Gemmatimonadales bacterium]